MRVLVVGGGGREHALAWGLAKSDSVDRLIVTPGNAGIASIATCEPGRADDIAAVVALAERETVDLVVVGPEAPLVAGLADQLRARGIAVFGPGSDAARLEGSKVWAKRIMGGGGIPTARSASFTGVADAMRFVEELGGPAVVKADGLAAGKGVTVARDRTTAEMALRDCLEDGAFGAAGSTVVVEEVLSGPEVSAFSLCDGQTLVPLALSQDFKRIGEDDTGPNTGGMGAYSPVPAVDAATEDAIWTLARRTIAALAEEGITYRGLLYLGLMLTAEGPKVLEYNCRFGDPETQALIPRLRSDLGGLLFASATGALTGMTARWSSEATVTVVLASGGYPDVYRTGWPIEGLEDAAAMEDTVVFHSGTEERQGRFTTAGGRVLAVSSSGRTIAKARDRAYQACGRIHFEQMTYRADIAVRAADREAQGVSP